MERQLIERAGLISKDNVANKLGGPFGALILQLNNIELLLIYNHYFCE